MAADMSRAARSGGRAVMSAPALSISVWVAISPWYRSGASAVKPSSASRSHTALI